MLDDGRLHRDSLGRVLPVGRLAREHHCVGLLEDRVGHVGHLGAGRPRVRLHRVEHLSRDHHRLARLRTLCDHLLLPRRHVRDRHLHAQVPARDHQPVRGLDDLAEPVERLGRLDLGYDERRRRGWVRCVLCVAVGDVRSDGVDAGGVADEGGGDHVDVVLDAEADVLQVLVGERRQVRHNAWQVHSLTLSDGRGVEHLARHAPVRPHLLHPQRDQPVVEQHHEPWRDL
mmetsp:Transcript_30200/g.95293  ORF Transcript_30200/g.95293 Transcript_30200/m.95293 type:complete len:229 (+) Transcript_30200:614-1300(+)